VYHKHIVSEKKERKRKKAEYIQRAYIKGTSISLEKGMWPQDL